MHENQRPAEGHVRIVRFISGLGVLRAHHLAFFLSAIILLLAFSFVPAMWSSHISGDGWENYALAHSFVFDRDFDIDNQLEHCCDQFQHKAHTVTGHMVCIQPPGTALLWVPFLALTHVTIVVFNALFASVEPMDTAGYTMPYYVGATLGSVLCYWLAFVLLFYAFRRFFRPLAALLGCMAAMWASNGVLFATIHSSYTHSASVFSTSLIVWLWARAPHSRRSVHWLLLGGAVGFSMLVRSQNLVFAAWPAMALILQVKEEIRSTHRWQGPVLDMMRCGALAAISALAIFSLQLFMWHHYTGEWVSVNQAPGYMRWSSFRFENVLNILFWSKNGAISWHPIYGLGFLFLIPALRRFSVLAYPALATLAAALYVNSVPLGLWGGWSYGHRRFIALLPLVVVGVGYCADVCLGWGDRRGWWRKVSLAPLALTCIALIALNISMMGRLRSRAIKVARVQDMRRVYGLPSGSPADMVWRNIGNPFTLPASFYYWYRFDIPFELFDRLVGRYFLFDFLVQGRALSNPIYARHKRFRDFLVRGVWHNGRAEPQNGRILWALPLWRLAYPLRLKVDVAYACSGVNIMWNGTSVQLSSDGVVEFGENEANWGFNRLEFVVPDGCPYALNGIVLNSLPPGPVPSQVGQEIVP